ncbi:MAG: hypothetical protein HFG88_14950, partial [Dorea sp.]|nr:hypothetical protein [Dorea sp.]
LSWIERLATDQKVGGSNPLAHVEVLADFLQGLFESMQVFGCILRNCCNAKRMSDGRNLGWRKE